MLLVSGAKLGPYGIQSPLGAGGMGEVYRARDPRLARVVAIKVLPEAFAADTDRLQRFEHEARVLSALNHPNLLTIYDVGVEGPVHYPSLNYHLLVVGNGRQILLVVDGAAIRGVGYRVE